MLPPPPTRIADGGELPPHEGGRGGSTATLLPLEAARAGVRRFPRGSPYPHGGRGRGPRRGRSRGHQRARMLPGLLPDVPRGFPLARCGRGGGCLNSFGVRYRTTVFGTSHGPFVGCAIEGLRAGTPIDARAVQIQLDRRRPGQSRVTTQRTEEDRVE